MKCPFLDQTQSITRPYYQTISLTWVCANASMLIATTSTSLPGWTESDHPKCCYMCRNVLQSAQLIISVMFLMCTHHVLTLTQMCTNSCRCWLWWCVWASWLKHKIGKIIQFFLHLANVNKTLNGKMYFCCTSKNLHKTPQKSSQYSCVLTLCQMMGVFL